MGKTKTPPIFVVIATFFIVGTLILSDQNVSADQCVPKMAPLVKKCAKFVRKNGPKNPPDGSCCDALKAVEDCCVAQHKDDAHVPCSCKYVRREIEAIVSMEKVVYVARTCGLKIDSQAKCGSYTVPPAETVPPTPSNHIEDYDMLSSNIYDYV
ncbi:Bifunctional inhibitor/lipid-transfer protein/seed storage 2S albumin superfamily protein [Euphorbia peplus]|nr:Bifunctional inhibitor/lipid-transfer protein/seed storage 2S albumin superfamily protein [Euphorbia peplus]